MFQSFNTSGRQQDGNRTKGNQVPVKLRMPAGFQGKAVPMSVVVMELLWQQYGLDLLHPEVSRWMEQYAMDVKSLVAGDCSRTMVTVGPKGTIEMNLSLKTDDRLRNVSSQYLLNQVERSMEPQDELLRAA